MRNQLIEACFKALAIYLLAFGVATVVVLGILLMPVLFIAIVFLAAREVVVWKRKQKIENRKTAVGTRLNRKAVIRAMPFHEPYKKAA
jgi:Flp pilus assembly protein TadB